MLEITHTKTISGLSLCLAIIVDDVAKARPFLDNDQQYSWLAERVKGSASITYIQTAAQHIFFLTLPTKSKHGEAKEEMRLKGHALSKQLLELKIKNITISSTGIAEDLLLGLAEGLALSSYEFLNYKSDKTSKVLHGIEVHAPGIPPAQIHELQTVIEAVFICRDLVNHPVVYLTAEQLSAQLRALGKEAGFDVEVYGKAKIKSLKMGGILAVNAGSVDEPTFNVLEYKPQTHINAQPIILVGKGVVYDTGGLSLKPTPGSMDSMKCDMAGAGAVAAVLYAVAKNNLPLHVMALIPATDNRPSGNAITPGDVITMHSGKTVEILNTDAEGRLILGDALSWAAQYNPQLVIDVATLTGAAAKATGKEAIVFMGNADDEVKTQLTEAGFNTFERLAELPLFDEYERYLDSDIADIKNIGGADAGAITAGIFLRYFTSYPWLHLDIAGNAFYEKGEWNYRGKQGTGMAVRLLYTYLRNLIG